MHWLEDLFGIKPDNGNGSMEFLIALAVSILVIPRSVRWIRQFVSSRKNGR